MKIHDNRNDSRMRFHKPLSWIVLFFFLLMFSSNAESNSNTLEAEMTELLSDSAHGKYSDAACISLMQKYWPSSFNEAWPKADISNSPPEERVPKEFLEVVAQPDDKTNFSIDSTLRSLSAGPQPVMRNNEEKTAFKAISGAYVLAVESSRANSVPVLFASMEDRLPTRKGDFVILSAANAYLHSRESITLAKMSPKDLESWNKFARSKNPVFRLLAAITFDSLVDNPENRGAFFSIYSKETDPEIVDLVIRMDASSGFKSQVPSLLKIADGQQAIGNIDTAKSAKEKAAYISANGVVASEGD